MKSFWVEITKCYSERCWYYQHIGASFEVTQRPDAYYNVVGGELERQGERLIIAIKDTKILEDEKICTNKSGL